MHIWHALVRIVGGDRTNAAVGIADNLSVECAQALVMIIVVTVDRRVVAKRIQVFIVLTAIARGVLIEGVEI